MEHAEIKTTLFLTPTLRKCLAKLSKMTGKSMGQLLREAVERQYFSAPSLEKKEIVHKMASMKIHVGTVEEMNQEMLKGFFGKK